MYTNLNLETETVVFDRGYKTEVVSLKALYARRFTMMYMAYDGILRDCLTEKEHSYIYANLCDGFGHIPDYYDWSHVRDSSWEAFINIAQWLTDNGKFSESFNKMYSDTLKAAKDLQSECDVTSFFIN